jgi:hypothetical protein
MKRSRTRKDGGGNIEERMGRLVWARQTAAQRRMFET